MPNPLHIDSNVDTIGTGLRLIIFAMTEFLENLGGGNADEGLNNIKSILDTWTPGSEHISRENPADKIKEGKEYFLKLVQDKYEAESNMHLKSHSKRNIQGEV